MTARFLLLLSGIILLSACAHKPPVQSIKPHKVTQVRPLAAFNHIAVNGRLNVVLHTGYSKPQIIVKGDARDTALITTVVKNNTLVVNLVSGYPKFGEITLDIRTRNINSFRYVGGGVIKGDKINSSALDLSITNPGRTILSGNIYLRRMDVHGSGFVEINGVNSQNLQLVMTDNPRVKLVGVANLTSINLEGKGWFGMYWVKSDRLKINATGHSYLYLAGIANRVDLELSGYARFHGRYLRVKRFFARTHDHSAAEISALDRQHTLATEGSDIYFYNIPDMKTDFMGNSGAVLDMRDLNPPELEEYTRYNK